MLTANKMFINEDWANAALSNAMIEVGRNEAVTILQHNMLPLAGHLVCDATPTRIASIFVDATGQVKQLTKDFHEADDIQKREAEATIMGLENIGKFEKLHELVCITDNTSWLHTANNRRGAPTAVLAEMKVRLMQAEKEKNVQIHMLYINTEENAADELSRGRATTTTRIWNTITRATDGGWATL